MKINRIYLYITASLLLPNIFLFFLFNNNKIYNNLYFHHFVIVGSILALMSFATFLLYRGLSKSYEAAIIILGISWFYFYFFVGIVNFFADISGSRRGITFIVTILLIASIMGLLFILRRYELVLIKASDIFNTISAIIIILFLYNFIPAFYSDVLKPLVGSSTTKQFVIKSEFNINTSLASPDIYWLHMDEMVSFSVIEEYFGDHLGELKEELSKRGFILNESASLHAGGTILALISLLNPALYDSYLESLFIETENFPRLQREAKIREQFLKDGLSIREDVTPRMELFRAFIAKGYTHVVVTESNGIEFNHGLQPMGWFYRDYDIKNKGTYLLINNRKPEANVSNYEKILDFFQLLTNTTPLSAPFIQDRIRKFIYMKLESSEDWLAIAQYEEIPVSSIGLSYENHLYRRLYDSFRAPSPKFVYVSNGITHGPYTYIIRTDGNPYNIDDLYLPHFKYAAKVMLNTIDMILEKNNDAIIIIQGDHGIHLRESHEYMRSAGYTEDQIIEINYSTISAVRIPDIYGGLEKPLEPLDISRTLINRFVGENY